MLVAFALVAVLALLAFHQDARGPDLVGEAAGPAGPAPLVNRIIEAAMVGDDPARLEAGARRLETIGYASTAEVLRERADLLREVAEDSPYGSPFPEATSPSWSRYVEAMGTADLDAISPSGHLGRWQLSPRRLQDLGLMAEVQQAGRLVTGTWVPPMTAERWQSEAAQYRAFLQGTADHRRRILGGPAIGAEVEGQAVTLSGALAVAKHATIKGLSAWLADPAERKRFPHTTSAFARCNGLF